MMKNALVTLGCFICLQLSAQTQDAQQGDDKSALSLQGINVMLIVPWSQHMANMDVNKMRAIAPESQILRRDLTGYEQNANTFFIGHERSQVGVPVSVLLHFDINSNKRFVQKFRPEVRFGLSYSRFYITSATYVNEQHFPLGQVDLKDGRGMVNADSVHTKSVSLNNRVRMLAGHASLILKSNPERRFHFFAGLGVEGGASITSRNEINYYESFRVDEADGGSTVDFERDPLSESEDFSSDITVAYSVFVPFGGSVRFSKKHRFFSKLNFFLEVRSLIYYNGRIDGGNYSFSTFHNQFSSSEIMGGYGLRFNF